MKSYLSLVDVIATYLECMMMTPFLTLMVAKGLMEYEAETDLDGFFFV